MIALLPLAALVAAAVAPPPSARGGCGGSTAPADYPAEALRLHQEGKVEVTLRINELGRGTACTVTRSSGAPSLDEATCRLMIDRARWEPARDEHGRPAPDVVKTSVDWRLPH
jgi:protein TonB